jgi:hypothetical protein
MVEMVGPTGFGRPVSNEKASRSFSDRPTVGKVHIEARFDPAFPFERVERQLKTTASVKDHSVGDFVRLCADLSGHRG